MMGKTYVKALIILLTSPIWILGGCLLIGCSIPMIIVAVVVSCMEWAFTGKWDCIFSSPARHVRGRHERDNHAPTHS